MHCKRCGCDWGKEYMSKLALFPEGRDELDLTRAEIESICNDCRNNLWADIFGK